MTVPRPFGFKIAWLAVPSIEPLTVAKVLRIGPVDQAEWFEGIEKAYASSVFVSPPVSGWILVVSRQLLTVRQAGWCDFMENTSSKLGEVQYFSTHRVVDLHVWAKARDGIILRACAYSGASVLMNIGEMTEEERLLGFHFRQPAGAITQKPVQDDQGLEDLWNDDTADFPDEQDVMSVAGMWSIDPTRLESYSSQGTGILGEAPVEWSWKQIT